MNLTVINYSMKPDSLVFSHQRDVVAALATAFDSVTVFTTECTSEALHKNIEIMRVPWKPAAILVNIYRILRAIVPHLIKSRNQVVFTHMSDIHAALISPFTKLLGIRHVFWYAHAHNSKYLIWSSFFVSKIVSSTPGSCNLKINRRKIEFINQGIDVDLFPFIPKANNPLTSILYYGRLDSSKNIDVLMRIGKVLHLENPECKLSIYGKSMTSESKEYMNALKMQYSDFVESGAIYIGGELRRREISQITHSHDFFVNLFSGSLDKTLIESTMMGMPVITWNLEYCKQFGTWSHQDAHASIDFILKEISHLRELGDVDLQAELDRRYAYAQSHHSFDGWIAQLRRILGNQ